MKKRKFKCPVCKSNEGFVLMPDYSSSGLWCITCGVNFGNPKEEFPKLPPGLVDLIDVWNCFWDEFASTKSKYNYALHFDMVCKSGEYLCELVNKFYPCTFRILEPYKGK